LYHPGEPHKQHTNPITLTFRPKVNACQATAKEFMCTSF